MKKISPPAIGSVLVMVIYVLHQRFHFDAREISIECYREAHQTYNLGIYLPVQMVLLLAAFLTMYIYRKELKTRILDYILVSPLVIHFLYFMFGLIRNLFFI